MVKPVLGFTAHSTGHFSSAIRWSTQPVLIIQSEGYHTTPHHTTPNRFPFDPNVLQVRKRAYPVIYASWSTDIFPLH